MRVYHLLPEKHALDDLKCRRLKVSRIDDMNDPFELLSLSLKTREHRLAIHNLKADFDKEWGALCFSRGWSNPVLWSHYADKHRGFCLGFDVPTNKTLSMSYGGRRVELDIDRELSRRSGPVALVRKLMTTKFSDWKYEREVRILVTLDQADPETGVFFSDFGRQLALREVIVGPRSTLAKDAVQAALSPEDGNVKIMKARLAFKTFRLVPQRDTQSWDR